MSTIVQQMYIAYFGRPADVAGLSHWDAHMAAHNNDPSAIINDFSASAEYHNSYDGQTYEFIVNSIYNNLYGRNAEPAGLVHFVNRLQSGENNIGDIAWQIMNDAQNSDRNTLANRANAAEAFTAAMDTTTEILAYSTYEAGAVARAWLATVDDTAASLTAAKAVLDATIQSIVDGTGITGDTFDLTTAVGEHIEGTANNDTINGLMDGVAATSTFNALDTIDGMGGNDTFNIVLDVVAGAITAPALSSVTNVERINLVSHDSTSFFQTDANGIDATYFDGATAIWQMNISSGNDVYNVGEGVTVGYANFTAADVVVAADGVTSAAVALDNVGTGSAIGFNETTAGDVTSISVSGSGATALTINTTALGVSGGVALTALETINLAITSDSTITFTTGATETTIDASASTGDLTFTATAAVDTIFGGSGDDTIVAAALASTIDAGAGADAITVSGLGDTLVVNAGDSGITVATADTITGFVSGADSFDFNLAAGTAANFQTGLNSGFLDALTTANTAFDGTVRYYVGDDGTDSYLFVDVNLDGTADMGITLLAVTGPGSFIAGDIIA